MNEALAHLFWITLSVSMEKFGYNYSLMDFHWFSSLNLIVNHWNKHNCFPNCSHIQVTYSVRWRVTSTTHKESLILYLPYTPYIWASNISSALQYIDNDSKHQHYYICTPVKVSGPLISLSIWINQGHDEGPVPLPLGVQTLHFKVIRKKPEKNPRITVNPGFHPPLT